MCVFSQCSQYLKLFLRTSMHLLHNYVRSLLLSLSVAFHIFTSTLATTIRNQSINNIYCNIFSIKYNINRNTHSYICIYGLTIVSTPPPFPFASSCYSSSSSTSRRRCCVFFLVHFCSLNAHIQHFERASRKYINIPTVCRIFNRWYVSDVPFFSRPSLSTCRALAVIWCVGRNFYYATVYIVNPPHLFVENV